MVKRKMKIAFVGTSCAGKTTAAFGLIARLKSYSVLAEGLTSQDRKFSFNPALLESEELAQNWMVANLIAKEVDAFLHPDVDVLISDRSPLDLLAYYAFQYEDSGLMHALKDYVFAYLSTYDALYYLPPLQYQDDGKRPSDSFRLGVDKVLLGLIEETNTRYPGLVQNIPRNKILESVLLLLGVRKPGVKTTVSRAECAYLARTCGATFYVKSSYFEKAEESSDMFSDVDIMIADPAAGKQIEDAVKANFGPWVTVDIVPIYEDLQVDLATFEKFAHD